jgi:hypothetical protein
MHCVYVYDDDSDDDHDDHDDDHDHDHTYYRYISIQRNKRYVQYRIINSLIPIIPTFLLGFENPGIVHD